MTPMPKAINTEINMNEKYASIINLPRHVSDTRPRMSNHDRAAQFAPYSALSGYEDAVEETARLTEGKIELDESEKEMINLTLTRLAAASPEQKIKITFFRPDDKKQGGAYVTVSGEISKIDPTAQEITLVAGLPIPFDSIFEIYEID